MKRYIQSQDVNLNELMALNELQTIAANKPSAVERGIEQAGAIGQGLIKFAGQRREAEAAEKIAAQKRQAQIDRENLDAQNQAAMRGFVPYDPTAGGEKQQTVEIGGKMYVPPVRASEKQYAHRIIETNGELYSYDPATDQAKPLGLKTKEKGQGKSRFKPTYDYQTGKITGSYDTWTGKLQDMTGKTVVPQAPPATAQSAFPPRPVSEWTDKELLQGYQDH